MDFRQTAALLREKDDFLILSHRRPDGDTIGCAAALCRGLRRIGKRAYCHPNEDAHTLFAPYLAELLPPAGFTPAFVAAVDAAAEDLLPDSAAAYLGRVDLCVDHHGSNKLYANTTCLDPSCAACGELVYYILRELDALSAQIAELLYIAVSTDTGCFVFSNTTAETHRIAAALVDFGFDVSAVNKLHFRTKSLRRLQLEGHIVRAMELFSQGEIAVATISLALLESLGANEEDLENISSFVEQLAGVRAAATLRENNPGEYKISLRTNGTLNAAAVCQLLGGGGHPAAAGGKMTGSPESVKAALLDAIAQVRGR
jgi:phosphoesterase RecJ-like protein